MAKIEAVKVKMLHWEENTAETSLGYEYVIKKIMPNEPLGDVNLEICYNNGLTSALGKKIYHAEAAKLIAQFHYERTVWMYIQDFVEVVSG